MKKVVSVLLLLAVSVVCLAQTSLPPKCSVFRPQVLNKNILTDTEAKELLRSANYGQTFDTKTFWTAYSDRADNVTYSGPSMSSSRFSSLAFNETVRIASIKNNMALVYVEKKQTDYPKISDAAVTKGWIPMSHLLLWQSCPTNSKGIYNKALLCINLDNAKDVKNIGYGYYAPDKSAGKDVLSTDMNFYFIMKKENGMALLARQSKMDGQYSDQVLFYWVPEQSYVPWNQRSCLEPTWKHEDVEYFASKNIQVNIFANKNLTGSAISHIGYHKKESPTYKQYLYRMDGNSLRFPILDDGGNAIYNMSTFSTIGGKAAGTEERDPISEADKKLKAKLERISHINLGIVIDGTSSMEPYYPAVKEAIKEGLLYFAKGAKIKVGVVIFRDYADGEKGLVEVMPLTPSSNMSRLNSFLDTGGSYGIKSSPSDKTQTEALYCGMNTALEKLAFNKEESNILLVVGDCGNDASDTKYSKETIIKNLVAKNVSLMGFQVQNRNVVAYSSFNDQLTDMIRRSLLGNYKAYDPKIVVRARQTKNGFDYYGNVTPQIYVANHISSDPSVNGGKMDPKKLSENMINSIGGFAQAIKERIDILTVGIQANNSQISTAGLYKKGSSVQGGDIQIAEAYLREILGEGYAEAMKGSNALLNFRGYAKRQDVSGRDFFKPVIFISSEEFDDLLKRMAPVYEAAKVSAANDRTPYIEAMKALVKSFAPGMSDADMAKLDNSQITRMIEGLNEAATSLREYRLDDISNKTVISNAKYMSIVTSFTKKYENLRRIRQSKAYQYVKEFNGSRYYWVPIEDLP